jgi:Methyltransferase domain
MTDVDVLMIDRIGGAYTHRTMDERGLGGSEIEVLQVSRALAKRGHKVVVANGVEIEKLEDGVLFVPMDEAKNHIPRRVLYLQRTSTPTAPLQIPDSARVIIRANDVYFNGYDIHRPMLKSGRIALVANTQWQSDLFGFAKERIVIAPMLDETPEVTKRSGLYVFASGPMKGYEATLAMWSRVRENVPSHHRIGRSQLQILSPGWGEYRELTAEEKRSGVRSVHVPTSLEYRKRIAEAEGLFYVNVMPETFCCAAALAERAGTRTHILCTQGLGGIPEAINDHSDLTEKEEVFIRDFIKGSKRRRRTVTDRRPDTLVLEWEKALHLTESRVPEISVEQSFPEDPTLAPNKEPLGPLFGDFLSLLRGAIAPGGSEFGVGLMLFSLAASTRAGNILEIGRFKGFSTLALAAACKLQDIGWRECVAAEQRPGIPYRELFGPLDRRVISVDPRSTQEADDLLAKAGLSQYVVKIDKPSSLVEVTKHQDLLFIDGSHILSDVRSDVHRFVPWVRPGGYFVLHDYFGWFKDGVNGSPIAEVIRTDLAGFDRILIDTAFASLVIFRKTQNLTEAKDLDPQPPRVAPRADGRPTVGLLVIAKGDEASTVIARLIVSAKRMVDCVTVVCDASEKTAEVARQLGADVYIRESPKVDWDKGIGIIGRARNEALAIAESRTDYLLIGDADDWFDGTLPSPLDKDAYEITVHDGGMRYPRIQLFRTGKGFYYTGICHEQLTFGGTIGKAETTTCLKYMRGQSSYGYQDRDPASIKYMKHAKQLLKWLVDHPEDTRSQFYLARSYHDAGNLELAKVEYEKRIAMQSGWDEEKYYSALQLGLITLRSGGNPTVDLLRAHEFAPGRAEPLIVLAQWHRDDKQRHFSTAYYFARWAAEMTPPANGIFVNIQTYEFEALSEWAICAYWANRKQEAMEIFQRVKARLPRDRQAWADDMVNLCRRDLGAQAAQ